MGSLFNENDLDIIETNFTKVIKIKLQIENCLKTKVY